MSGPYSHGHSAALPPQPMLAASVSLGSAPLHGGDRLTKHGLQVMLTRLHPEPRRAVPGLKECGPQVIVGAQQGTQRDLCSGQHGCWVWSQGAAYHRLGAAGLVSWGHWSWFCWSLGELSEAAFFQDSTSSTVSQSAQESPAREAGLLMTVIEGVVGVPGSAGEPSQLHLSQEA